MVSPFYADIETEASVSEDEIGIYVEEWLEKKLEVNGLVVNKILNTNLEIEEAFIKEWKFLHVEIGDYLIQGGRVWNCKEVGVKLEASAEEYEDPYDDVVFQNCSGLNKAVK